VKNLRCLGLHEGSDFGVQHKDHGSSDSTESVGTSSLEQSGGSFVLHNLSETVHGSAVNPFGLGLFRLHLKATTDGVEGVRGVSGHDGGKLGASELGSSTEEIVFGLLVRVVSRKGVEETEVDTTVRDDTNNGDTDTIVKTSDSGALDGLGKTVHKSTELLLSTSDIGRQSSTGVVKGVDDHERSGSSQTSRGHVDGEELEEFCVLVSPGEHGLDGILEGKVEGLGGEVTDDVGQVSTPEGTDTLLGGDSGEAVHDTGVSLDLSRNDLGVGILGLDKKLHTLDGSSGGLGDSAGNTAGHKVDEEISHGGM